MGTPFESLEPRQLLSNSAIWRIDGTPNNDQIIIRASPTHRNRIEAVVNASVLSSRSAKALRQVLIKSGRGDDQIQVRLGSKSAHFRLYGGRGDDILTGGSGRDILVGGPGADRLSGGKDRSPDSIYRDDSDVLVGARHDRLRYEKAPNPPAQITDPSPNQPPPSRTIPLEPGQAATLEEGINRFAFDLFSVLTQQDPQKNLFFSPYSIATALGMLGDATDSAAANVADLLHRTAPDLAASFTQLLDGWQANPDQQRPYELSIANAGWFSDFWDFPLEYSHRLQVDFNAEIQRLDFTQPQAAVDVINAWVSELTHGRIPKLIEPGFVNQYTHYVLTNAMYFKGQWASGFDRQLTRSRPFSLPNGTTRNVAMMHQEGTFKYFANDQLQLLELPYKGDDLSMVVMLPRNDGGLRQLAASISTASLSRWLNEAYRQKVLVYLPRFEMDSNFHVLEALEKLGLNTAISDTDAVSDIVHQANIEVNEEGTVASAATAIGVVITGCVCSDPAPPTFNADHPFLYAIRDNRTGGLLFLGQETEPANAPADMPTTPVAGPHESTIFILEPFETSNLQIKVPQRKDLASEVVTAASPDVLNGVR